MEELLIDIDLLINQTKEPFLEAVQFKLFLA